MVRGRGGERSQDSAAHKALNNSAEGKGQGARKEGQRGKGRGVGGEG